MILTELKTPWGNPDQPITEIMPGFYWVTTPSHGGYLIDELVAREILPHPQDGRFVGIKCAPHYLAYEEDCAWSVLVVGISRLDADHPVRRAFEASLEPERLAGCYESAEQTARDFYPDLLTD